MKKNVLTKDPIYFDGRPNMGIHISLILDNNYHIEIEKCMLLVPSVEQKLMSLVKGDTFFLKRTLQIGIHLKMLYMCYICDLKNR